MTETDNLLFTMLSLNTNELHFNEEAAKQTEWGRVLVNSTFTLALVLGLSVADTSQAGAVNLGWTEIRLPAPVFVGDTIWSETEVTSVRESESRPTHGIVGVRTRGINQRRRSRVRVRALLPHPEGRVGASTGFRARTSPGASVEPGSVFNQVRESFGVRLIGEERGHR